MLHFMWKVKQIQNQPETHPPRSTKAGNTFCTRQNRKQLIMNHSLLDSEHNKTKMIRRLNNFFTGSRKSASPYSNRSRRMRRTLKESWHRVKSTKEEIVLKKTLTPDNLISILSKSFFQCSFSSNPKEFSHLSNEELIYDVLWVKLIDTEIE